MHSVFTVYYQGPYWVGVLERYDTEGYWVGRHVFGGEPSNAELEQFLANEFDRIRLALSPLPLPENALPAPVPNAKRALRIAKKEQGKGLDSYTHIALQSQLKNSKLVRKEASKADREAAAILKFQLRADKRREKKKGH